MKSRLRYFSAAVLAHLLIALGFTRRAKRRALKGDYILSVFCHSPDRQLFDFCIGWFKKKGFLFLTPADIEDIKESRKPFPKGAVILTVDDGWESNELNVGGVANKYKVPVTVFVSTGPTEKGAFWWSYIPQANQLNLTNLNKQALKQLPNFQRMEIVDKMASHIRLPREAMTKDQVRKIADSPYVVIGSHTVSHPILIRCKDEESLAELKDSRRQLEEWISKPVSSFSYPNGDYSKRDIDILRKVGYHSAFTTVPEYLTRAHVNNIYELPRFCVFEKTSKAETICRMLGVWETFLIKANCLKKY